MSTTPVPTPSHAAQLANSLEALIKALTPIGFGIVGLFFHNANSQMQLQSVFTTVEGAEGIAQTITPIIEATFPQMSAPPSLVSAPAA